MAQYLQIQPKRPLFYILWGSRWFLKAPLLQSRFERLFDDERMRAFLATADINAVDAWTLFASSSSASGSMAPELRVPKSFVVKRLRKQTFKGGYLQVLTGSCRAGACEFPHTSLRQVVVCMSFFNLQIPNPCIQDWGAASADPASSCVARPSMTGCRWSERGHAARGFRGHAATMSFHYNAVFE